VDVFIRLFFGHINSQMKLMSLASPTGKSCREAWQQEATAVTVPSCALENPLPELLALPTPHNLRLALPDEAFQAVREEINEAGFVIRTLSIANIIHWNGSLLVSKPCH
jgi:hypothetical protein